MANAPTHSAALTEPEPEPASLVISANAAKVLETTRRAWQTHALHAPAENKRAAKTKSSKKRVSPRRSQWGNLVAALNYWSPKPL
jgi:hypothetical protein